MDTDRVAKARGGMARAGWRWAMVGEIEDTDMASVIKIKCTIYR